MNLVVSILLISLVLVVPVWCVQIVIKRAKTSVGKAWNPIIGGTSNLLLAKIVANTFGIASRDGTEGSAPNASDQNAFPMVFVPIMRRSKGEGEGFCAISASTSPQGMPVEGDPASADAF